MERGELLKEYESIPRRHPARECCVAQLPESSDKNRFHDVLPYDSTRVELVPTKENNTGYINASHVKVSSRSSVSHEVVGHKEEKRKGLMDCVLLANCRRAGVELHRLAGAFIKHMSGFLADGVGTGHLHHRHGYC